MTRWWNVVAQRDTSNHENAMVINIWTENSSINTKATSFDASSIKWREKEEPLQRS
jgi:hypothetical protein